MTPTQHLRELAAAITRSAEIEKIRPGGTRGIAIHNDALAREWQQLDDFIECNIDLSVIPALLAVAEAAQRLSMSDYTSVADARLLNTALATLNQKAKP